MLSSFSHMDFTITMVQNLVHVKPLFSIHYGGHGRRLYISASDIWFEEGRMKDIMHPHALRQVQLE